MTDMDRVNGFYKKFTIKRTDGRHRRGEKHHGCRYFVLDLDHDPHAIPAIRVYAESCAESHRNLARDLLAIARALTEGKNDGTI
jgi:hypothetical protein